MRKIAPFSSSPSTPVSRARKEKSPFSASVSSHSTSSHSTLPARAPSTSSSTVTPQQLAEAFQVSVDLQTHKCQKTRKKYKKAFTGSEAVELIQELAGLEARQDAVHAGRLMQSSLNLFQCCNSLRVYQLEDSPLLLYQFIKPKKQRKIVLENPQETMKLFLKRVEDLVRDRDYLVTNYRQVFVGREAVDVMMASGMGNTREECVQIGRILMNQYHLFEPVTSTGFILDFEDDSYKFYRFTTNKIQEKAPTFLEEIKPARWLIASFLVPACIAYHYFY